nr:hypothetical protein [Tanacetum cinerariifolium]
MQGIQDLQSLNLEDTGLSKQGVNERVTEIDTTVRQRTVEFKIQFEEAQDDRALLRARVNTLFRDRPDHRRTSMLLDREAMAIMYVYQYCYKMEPKKRTMRATPVTITTLTTTVTDAQLQALIDRGIAAVLAERDADMSRNGDNSNDSGIGGKRKVTTQRECTYTDFLKCQPMTMSSDSNATITYTSMSSYEVTVNGYFGMSMDPLDPYAQLVIKATPSPDYIPGPEAPSSPEYIPGLEYPEYLSPADDVFPVEEQLLPAVVSPTAEGDDDANDDGDDLSEDDVDEEDEEESSDREEEEEEHLALVVPAPTLHSSISAFEDSDQTEPFEEGETAAIPPPSAYRVTTRISIPMPFPSESEVERLLAIPTPPLSPVSPKSYPLPPFLMPLPIFTPLPPPPPIILPHTRASMVLMRSAAPSTFILAPLSRTPPIGTPPMLPIPLPTSSFPLPLLLSSTSCREGIPEADMPLRKKARFTTPIGGYEVGESSVAAAARQIRPAFTIDNNRRAEDRLIGRLRGERRYFRTLSTTYAQEVDHSRDYCTRIMDYYQSREVHTSTLVTQIEAL